MIVDAHARRIPRFKPEAIEVLRIREKKARREELVVARLEAKRWLELNDLLALIPLASRRGETTGRGDGKSW